MSLDLEKKYSFVANRVSSSDQRIFLDEDSSSFQDGNGSVPVPLIDIMR